MAKQFSTFDGILSSEEDLERAIQKHYLLYPSEMDCQRYVYSSILSAKASRCRNCGNTEFDIGCKERFTNCTRCGRIWWITAGTFFSRVKSLRVWCLAIWLIEQGVSFNAHKLSLMLEKCYSVTYAMLAKIRVVIERNMTQFTEVPSLIFERLYGRRTTETPAREHPRAEEDEALRRSARPVDIAVQKPAGREGTKENSAKSSESLRQLVKQETSKALNSDNMSNHPSECDLDETSLKILSILRENTHVHFDTLAERMGLPAGALSGALAMMEIDGIVEYSLGDWYSLKRTLASTQSTENVSPETNAQIESFLRFVNSTYQRIGRKYVQLYLSLHWCLTDRSRWGEGALMMSCAHSPYVSSGQISRYVSDVLSRIGCASEFNRMCKPQ